MSDSHRPRLLSKSRFKLALDCPTKLYYTDKKHIYANQSVDDPFLQALADGGFQVGELAKAYYPGGVEIATRDYDKAVAETNELLKRDDVIIFEAAFRHDKFIVFVDVIRKKGNSIDVIEVKSKTFKPGETEFFGKRGGLDSTWKPYLYDVAFQKHVVAGANPELNVSAFLMLVDKSANCPSDRLHQKFRIQVDDGGRRSAIAVEELTKEEFDNRILTEICVDDVCEHIYSSTTFHDDARLYAEIYERDEFVPTPVSKTCKTCEFQTTPEDIANGLKNGRHNCWSQQLGWPENELDAPTVIDIWDMRSHEKLIKAGKIKLSQLTEDDIGVKEEDAPGISRTQRQWLQVQKHASGDTTPHLDRESLRAEMRSWKFPLHFIDFETATPAIPFNAGRKPYGEVAFQFSHHVVHEDGRVEHRGQYLNDNVGEFPNFGFVRALRHELSQDNGTIFRYADHENTYLRAIRRQIIAEGNLADADELCEFIDSITSWKDGKDRVDGPRTMVDLRKLVLRYYYDPSMGGSNSIKKVLPAVLGSSEYLKQKYSNPEISSLNYPNGKRWVEIADGKVTDPYKLLEKLYASEMFEDQEERELKDGGAAMVAYARLQFEDISDAERTEIRNGLLRYCELDTLAMVMIYEAWREMLR